MFCPKCGSNVPDSTKFCPTCGALLADEAQQAPATEPQPQYQQPVYQAAPADNPAALKVSEFFWTDFLLAIPVVNLILALVWGFSSDVNLNKRNYCRSKLIWILIRVALYVLAFIFILAIGGIGALTYNFY